MNIHESLKQLGNLMTKKLNDSLDQFDLTCSQSSILLFILLNEDQKVNQRQIEKKFALSNPTVNGILNRLENKELIKRTSDSLDKRINNIIPLAKAYDFMDTIKKSKEKIEKNMIKDITDEELETLYRIINKMNRNLKEL